jgi:hypothetical protein
MSILVHSFLTRKGAHRIMSFKQKRWESVEKTSIDIATLVDRYLSACCSAGFSDKTIRSYNEKLGR